MYGEVFVDGDAKKRAIECSGTWILMREESREEKYGKRAPKDEKLVRGKGGKKKEAGGGNSKL